jgi:hypothetical protein
MNTFHTQHNGIFLRLRLGLYQSLCTEVKFDVVVTLSFHSICEAEIWWVPPTKIPAIQPCQSGMWEGAIGLIF